MKKQLEMLTITKVNEETFNDLLLLIKKLAEYEKLDPPNEEAKKRLQVDCLSDKPKYQAFIAKIGNKAVAYVIYFFTYSSFLAQPTLYLEDIFVLQEHRQSGIGKKLFEYCKQIANREGCGRIEFTVLKWNKSAQKFYENNKAKRLQWYLYRVEQTDF
jgi:GNAT superfamily N-acetyltransferase